MASFLFRKGAKEWHNPIMLWLTRHYRTAVRTAILHRKATLGIATALFAIAIYLAFGGPVGSEFLPHLDEGAIWARGTLADSKTTIEELYAWEFNGPFLYDFTGRPRPAEGVGRHEGSGGAGMCGESLLRVSRQLSRQHLPVAVAQQDGLAGFKA